MTAHTSGWLETVENAPTAGKKDYSLDKSISKITPESVEDEAKNIKLVRAVLFKYGEAGKDIGAILNRRLQIVEDEKKSDTTLLNRLLQIVKEEKESDTTELYKGLSKLVKEEKKSNTTELYKGLSKLVKDEKESETILSKRLLELLEDQKKSITTPYLFIPVTKDAEINPDQTLRLPSKIDLGKWFCKVQSQGRIQSCTAHAGIALMEYFQNRISGDIDCSGKPSYLSWRFLYRVTRNLEGIDQKGESQKKLSETNGATIRQTLKAMVLFGVPPENDSYWTSRGLKSNQTVDSTSNQTADYTNCIDEEPSSFLYAYAQNFQATNYFRLDKLKVQDEQLKNDDLKDELIFQLPEKIKQNGSDPKDCVTINELILIQVRISIASGFPCIFGIKNTNIFGKEDVKKVNDGKELGTDQFGGGHALVAVGYDDEKLAFKVRNSWDDKWGENGYGWLPYNYLLTDQAINWWSMLDAEWIDFGEFGLDIKNGELLPLDDEKRLGDWGGGRWWTSVSAFK